MFYAGIGSRQTPPEVLRVMYQTAQLLAQDGYTLKTGAAKGADQAFANGASSVFGKTELQLPWWSYEKDWISTLNNTTAYTIQTSDVEAFESVKRFHPAPDKLTQGPMKLHGRNYLIVDSVSFIVCWTPRGAIQGGTGQALRIAQEKSILVYNLGLPEQLKMFKDRITERGL